MERRIDIIKRGHHLGDLLEYYYNQYEQAVKDYEKATCKYAKISLESSYETYECRILSTIKRIEESERIA